MTEIPGMVDRVAAAIVEAYSRHVVWSNVGDEIVPADLEASSAAIAAHEAALRDAGMVIVPREPTEEMLRVTEYDPNGWAAAGNWRAMVAAAQRGCAAETLEDSHWGRFMQTGGSAPPDKSK